MFLAFSIDLKGDEIKDFWHGLVPYLGLSGFFAALILAEHNMSIATIIMIVTFIMLFVAGGRIKHLFGIILPSLFTLAIFFIFSSDYRRKRMLNFMNPWKDQQMQDIN